MTFDYFLGWDCSKLTLNYALVNGNAELLESGQIINQPLQIQQLVDRLVAELACAPDAILQCAETTGIYTNFLKSSATEHAYTLWCEDALELKLRSGRQKTKTDEVDAVLIARYAMRYADQAKPYELPDELILQIKTISRQRARLLDDVRAWKVRLQEDQTYGLVDSPATVRDIFANHIANCEQAIAKLDMILTDLIKSQEKTKRQYDIALSVPGFGKKNTIVVIAETELFTKTPSARACASYAGVCPYRYESGTSVNRRRRTLKPCNKRLKTALHQGAMSLIKIDNIYQRLYLRLKQKGRTHLQALNAVRNKMIRVLYACLENDVMYEKKRHDSLQVL